MNGNVALAENNGNDIIRQLEERIDRLERQEKKVKSASGGTTVTGISRSFNPAISANVLLRGTYNSEGNADSSKEVKTGMKVEEMELRFSSWVDTYLKADMTLAIEGTESIEIEETKAELLLDNNLSLTAGKFFTAFGKHNLLHTHAFPFIDAPLANEEIFGEEGLNEIGLGVNYLLPTSFFSELTFQFLEGDNAQFAAKFNDDFAYLGHSKNLWELNDETTMELGASYAYGKNSFNSIDYDETYLAGGDLTLKWSPAGRETYRSLVWQTELITSTREQVKTGVYTLAQYQFAKQWWIQGRYDHYEVKEDLAENKDRWSALLAFAPSEFSALRLQYNLLNQATEDEHQVFLQLNYTFGSHPAHNY
ncbi:MAG: hypothetical protein G3M78_12785 [Candidatus Nitrohelix vancouverensis]|uniref:Phosphate-selective porin O and P n=1 Tax=Candidatus Nitrohelix vancouverensis TaxID=2705534 RepID=A0A7T0C455_9BACT|nr:MAG: hypothetical protein G3M78_12785 [Candidatus Nitrohelix vancouverensis]